MFVFGSLVGMIETDVRSGKSFEAIARRAYAGERLHNSEEHGDLADCAMVTADMPRLRAELETEYRRIRLAA